MLLDLDGPDELAAAVRTIRGRAEALGARIDGIRIEKQVRDGVPILLGLVVDPQLGPALAIGAGGIYTEILDDVAILMCPATPEQVRAAVGGLRVAALLDGARGQGVADLDALVRAAVAVSQFGWAARAELAALDINPILIHPAGAGATVVDAVLVRAAPALNPHEQKESCA